MKFHTIRKLFTTCLILLALSACASGPYYGAAKIVSEPSGAEVINLKDGSLLGITPTTVWWKEPTSDQQEITLRLKLDGYYDKVAPFWLSMRHETQQSALDSPTLVEASLLRRDN
ncbi:MAG: hypothetical protein AAF197_00295 [Pseudomonadota bacterium]